jgi:hypothetical protein
MSGDFTADETFYADLLNFFNAVHADGQLQYLRLAEVGTVVRQYEVQVAFEVAGLEKEWIAADRNFIDAIKDGVLAHLQAAAGILPGTDVSVNSLTVEHVSNPDQTNRLEQYSHFTKAYEASTDPTRRKLSHSPPGPSPLTVRADLGTYSKMTASKIVEAFEAGIPYGGGMGNDPATVTAALLGFTNNIKSKCHTLTAKAPIALTNSPTKDPTKAPTKAPT